VARVSESEGRVSYSPAGEDDWLRLMRNRPLVQGDRLWTDRDARAEIQVGSAAVRLGPESGFEILELNDDFAQLLLTEGTLNLSIRRLQRGQSFEVATPNLALSFDRPGRYRIDVDPQRNETTVVVREGSGEAFGDSTSFALLAGDAVRFYDDDLRDYQIFDLPRADGFDRYSASRDRLLTRSVSLRYVDDDMVGYASLDAYGSWRTERDYGNVWYPTQVDAGWAPYRDGHWVWQEPWGWTWVDEAPWGFAPSHYGRWAHISNRWGWIPGPRNVRSVYSPAVVAFVGGSRWSLSISSGGAAPIGWFPLGPREVYVPSYHASRDYFARVNVNNTTINNTSITNFYNNYSSGTINVTQVNYVNRGVIGAVTAVPTSVFVNARSVRQEAIRLDRNALANAEYFRVAAVVPSQRSVIGSASASNARPSRGTFDRRIVARSLPPPAAPSFAVRAEQLRQTPGRVPRAARVATEARPSKQTDNVQVVGDNRRAVNAREVDPRRGGVRADAAASGRQVLDRSDEARLDPARGQTERKPSARDPSQSPRRERNQDHSVEPPSNPPAAQRERQRNDPQPRVDEVQRERREQRASDRQQQIDERDEQSRKQNEAAAQQQLREPQPVQRQRQDERRAQQAEEQSGEAARPQQSEQQALQRQRQDEGRAQQARDQQQAEAAAREQQAVQQREQQREQNNNRQRDAAAANPQEQAVLNEPPPADPAPERERKPKPRQADNAAEEGDANGEVEPERGKDRKDKRKDDQ